MKESEKQFSFTRAAPSTSGRARKQCLISSASDHAVARASTRPARQRAQSGNWCPAGSCLFRRAIQVMIVLRHRISALNLAMMRRAVVGDAVRWINRCPNPRQATLIGFLDLLSARQSRRAFSLVTARHFSALSPSRIIQRGVLNPHVRNAINRDWQSTSKPSRSVPIDNMYWMAKRGVLRLRAVFPARKNSYVRFMGCVEGLTSTNLGTMLPVLSMDANASQ